MTVLEHQRTPGMKWGQEATLPKWSRGALEFPARVGGSVRTEPQEIPSCLAMFQLLKLSLNVISAYWG